MVVRGEVARGSVVPDRDQLPRTVRPSAAADFLLPAISVAAALVLWELVVRAGLISATDLPAMSTTMQELWSMRARPPSSGRTSVLHRAWLGARPRDRDRARRPDRDRARRERARRPRVPGAGRVPAADPLGGADPAPLPHARPVAEERGLPGRVRRVLAAARADDLRRPRRRPAGDRHRAVFRRRPVSSASTGSRCRARCPYIATGMRISSTVALILAFTAELFMGTPGLGQAMNSRSRTASTSSCTRWRSRPACSASEHVHFLMVACRAARAPLASVAAGEP